MIDFNRMCSQDNVKDLDLAELFHRWKYFCLWVQHLESPPPLPKMLPEMIFIGGILGCRGRLEVRKPCFVDGWIHTGEW